MNAKQLVEFAADLRLDVPGAKLALLVAVEGFESAEITRLRAEVEALRADAARYLWLASSCRSTGEHWGGRWSIVIEGPAPKSHDSEDDFDDAIDAARAAQGCEHAPSL